MLWLSHVPRRPAEGSIVADGYPNRERALAQADVCEASYSNNELIVPLAEALRAIDAYCEVGVRWVAAERLSGMPTGQINGGVDLGTGYGIWGWSDDYRIGEFPAAIDEMDRAFRAVPDNEGWCLLFTLMIMDDDHPDD